MPFSMGKNVHALAERTNGQNACAANRINNLVFAELPGHVRELPQPRKKSFFFPFLHGKKVAAPIHKDRSFFRRSLLLRRFVWV